MRIALFAPNYHDEENVSVMKLSKHLNGIGHKVYTSKLEAKLIEDISLSRLSSDEVERLSYISLAKDIYELYEADVCIGVMNGRVPDESVMVKLGIASALQIPILLYKFDTRVCFIAGDNSMIIGVSASKVITSAKKLDKKLKKMKINLTKACRVPIIDNYYNLGQELDIKQYNCKDILSSFGKHRLVEDLINYKNIQSNKYNPINNVYCSGALFSSDEQRQMQSISDALEANKHTTYLPHRDGAEPYVMSNMTKSISASRLITPITNYINKMIYIIDIENIIKSESILVNLNGRAYDEGAMIELGTAFGMGKAIIYYKSDVRECVKSGLHPIINAVNGFVIAVDSYALVSKAVNSAIARVNEYNDKKKYQVELSEYEYKICHKAATYHRLLRCIPKPKNKILLWMEDVK